MCLSCAYHMLKFKHRSDCGLAHLNQQDGVADQRGSLAQCRCEAGGGGEGVMGGRGRGEGGGGGNKVLGH